MIEKGHVSYGILPYFGVTYEKENSGVAYSNGATCTDIEDMVH